MEPTRSQSEDEGEVHPLGVVLSRYKKEKKIPSYRTLARASGLNKTILSRMMGGELLEEPATRRRVLQIIEGLYSLHAIRSETEANEILQTVFPNEMLHEEETKIIPLLRMQEEEQASSAVSHADRAMELAPLFGREQAIADILQLLREGQKPLLTLTGEGGVGKTRLAREVRKREAASKEIFADGCAYISLAEVSDASSVAFTIAWKLGLKDVSDLPILERLKSYLRDKHLLLVLDNFEQVQEAAPLLTELLLDCPKLKMLVTSRVPLLLHYEQVFEVQPLASPEPTRISDIGVLKQYAATELYIQRAQAIDSHFVLTKDNAPLIAAICRDLDGLPLAIEIAASRIEDYPPEKLYDDLMNAGAGIKLKNPYQDIPERHRTLQQTIAWSYNLLNVERQKLFRRLAVFAGGCSLEAAAEVCSLRNDLPSEVSDIAWSLIKWHLIRLEGRGSASRLTMLNTIQEYAQEKLEEAGEDVPVAKQHRNFYLRMAKGSEGHLRGPDQVEWRERLESERENFDAALQWSLQEKAGAASLLHLTGELWWFWYHSGSCTYGRRWLDRALGQSTAPKHTRAYAKALYAAGVLAFYQTDYRPRTYAVLEESIKLYRKLNDAIGVAFSQVSYAMLQYQPDDPAPSLSLLQESVQLFQKAGHEWGVAWAQIYLGFLERSLGNYKEASRLFRECLSIYQTLGDQHGVAWLHMNLGDIERFSGNYEKAKGYYGRSLTGHRKLKDAIGIAWSLRNLGITHLRLEHYEQATLYFSEGLSQAWGVGEKLGIYGCLLGLALVLTKEGQWIRAAHLFAVAEPLLKEIGPAHFALLDFSKDEVAGRMETIREQLGEEAFRAAWRDGQRMALKDVITSVRTRMLSTAPAEENVLSIQSATS